jgi:benzoylformate decarboxylase
MATVREVTYDLMRALGMTTVFGNPGSTEETFLQDFPDDFTYVLGLQEAAAIGMADGFVQTTGRAALVNLHTAPGVGNAMGGLVTAWHGRAPLVITAGQQVRPMLAVEPWLVNVEAVELPKPYVKWSYEPARAEDVPGAIERAYHTAMQAPMGPVFVSIPMDDWGVPAAPRPARSVSYRTAPDPARLAPLAAALGDSARPALVLGAAVDRAGAWDAAVALAERTRAAVYGAPAAERVSFPEDHPLFQGNLPPAIAPLAARLREHDLVVAIGAPVFRYYPHLPGPHLHAETELFHLTEDPNEAARAPVGSAVVGDVGLALERLVELVPRAERAAPPPRQRPAPPPATDPITAAYAMYAFGRALPEGAVAVNESASNAREFHAYVPITRPGGYHRTASGALGFGLPAAVGMQLARPERPVACILGDGAFMYAPQALWTAAQLRLPVVTVVLRNGHYAILKAFAAFERVGERVPGLEIPDLDIVQLARGHGCEGRRVQRAADLEDALRAAFADAWRSKAPIVVEVEIEREVPPLL